MTQNGKSHSDISYSALRCAVILTIYWLKCFAAGEGGEGRDMHK